MKILLEKRQSEQSICIILKTVNKVIKEIKKGKLQNTF